MSWADLVSKEKEAIGSGKRVTNFIPFRPRYQIQHLTHFSEIDKVVKLVGDEYIPAKKAFYYKVFSLPVEEVMLPLPKPADLRINLNFVTLSGHGKSMLDNVLEFESRLNKGGNTLSLSHTEQLKGSVASSDITAHVRKRMAADKDRDIGVTVSKIRDEIKNAGDADKFHIDLGPSGAVKQYEKIPGWLKDGCLLIPEGYNLLTSKDVKWIEVRDAISTALDPIGTKGNEIVKRMTGHPEAATLRYHAKASFMMETQPMIVPSEVFNQGFPNRFLNVFVNPQRPTKESLGAGLRQSPATAEKDYIVGILWDIKNNANLNLVIPDDVTERVTELAFEVPRLLKTGQKADGWLRLLDWRNAFFIYRMAAILTCSEKRNIVTVGDVEKAYIDYVDILDSTMRWINKFAEGNIGMPYYDGREERMMNILRRNPKITIQKFLEIVAKDEGIGEERARQIYLDLKNRKILNSRQVGKTSSEVWLTSKGAKDDLEQIPFMDSEYFAICKNLEKGIFHSISEEELKKLLPYSIGL